MKVIRTSLFIAGLAVVGTVSGTDAPQANVQLTMLTKVNPQGLALWDITNGAMDDKGELAGSKVTPENWAKLLTIGKALEEGGRTLATKNRVVAAPAGSKLQDEGNSGASTAADVQRYIDAQPAEFRRHALELQKTGAGLIEAVGKHDARQLSDLASSLDQVCENCHVTFWYPQLNK